jgi:hypothetical protein
MLTKTKIALAATIVLASAFSASAATKARVTQENQVATYDAIPGYDSSGATVAVPDPDRQHS